MCDDCTDRAWEAATEAEDKAERYEKALYNIRAMSESYRLYTNHMDPLTRELVQDIFKTYDDLAARALENEA